MENEPNYTQTPWGFVRLNKEPRKITDRDTSGMRYNYDTESLLTPRQYLIGIALFLAAIALVALLDNPAVY